MLNVKKLSLIGLLAGIVLSGPLHAWDRANLQSRVAQGILNHKKKIGFTIAAPFIITALIGAILRNNQIKGDTRNNALQTTNTGTSYLYHQCGNSNVPTVVLLPGWPEDTMNLTSNAHIANYLNNPGTANFLMPIFANVHEDSPLYMFKTAFGQESDVRSVLSCIKEKLLCGDRCEKIIFCGRSRGGLVLGHVLEVLSTPDHNLLTEFEINETQRMSLLNRISRICLSVPLVDVKETLQHMVGSPLGLLARYITLPIATAGLYLPGKNKNLVNMIPKWQVDRKIPMTLILSDEDEVVGNRSDDKLEAILKDQFDSITIRTVYGHNDSTQDKFMKELVIPQ